MPADGMRPVILRAGCKVNLSLRVTGRRDDGYHDLDSVFWPFPEPADTLRVTHVSGSGLSFSCSDPALETPGNIVVKAYTAFAGATSFAPGLAVYLEKNIPSGAGLGGGSSDAAALLVYLNGLAAQEGASSLTPAALVKLGAKLGADVPFFFRNEPAHVSGIGDILTPLSAGTAKRYTGLHLVLVCPRIHVSTAWAFGAWDEKHQANGLTNGGAEDTSPLVCGVSVRNDLCEVVFDRFPELGKTLARMNGMGADIASMSGSGSSLFGLFRARSDAENATRFFRENGEVAFHHIL